MATYLDVHPVDPQPRAIRTAVDRLRDGALIAYPTDSRYALGAMLGNQAAKDRIMTIRHLDDKHHFTLICRDFAQLGQFVIIDNAVFRAIKAATPGPYTFILPATKEVPRRLSHPSRKTIGLRVPEHAVVLALLAELEGPLLTSTLLLPGEELPLTDPEEIRERMEKLVDLVIEAGPCGAQATTVIDLSSGTPQLVREGRGALAPFGLG